MQISLHLRPPTLGQETLPPPQSSQSPDTGEYCITTGGAPTATAILFYVLPFSFLVSGFCNYYCCQRTRKISVKLTIRTYSDKAVLEILESQLSKSTSTPCYQGEFSPCPDGQFIPVSLILKKSSMAFL